MSHNRRSFEYLPQYESSIVLSLFSLLLISVQVDAIEDFHGTMKTTEVKGLRYAQIRHGRCNNRPKQLTQDIAIIIIIIKIFINLKK